MPLLDYICTSTSCHVTVERIVRNSSVEVECPECGSPMVSTLPTRLAAHCYGIGVYKPSVRD